MAQEESVKNQSMATQLPEGLLAKLREANESNADSGFNIASNFSDRYELGLVLGEGGAGRVIAAYDKNVRRRVAIKFIRSDKASEIALRYFLKEAKITGQLQHPHIIPLYELGMTENEEIYYVMKLVQGVTLDEILEGIRIGDKEMIERFPLPSLMKIYRRVCEAVSYAHAKGVVHLDLKPDNILVGYLGDVQVTDWGLARLRRGMEDMSELEMVDIDEDVDFIIDSEKEKVIGTPAFMSPEQAIGNSDLVGTRSDVYALGGVLYKILTLRAPANGKTTTAVLRRKLNEKIKHPLLYSEEAVGDNPDNVKLVHLPNCRVPRSLAAICMKALDEKLIERYQKVGDLMRDVEVYMAGYIPDADKGAGLNRHFSQFIYRNQKSIVLVLISIFAVLTSIIILLLLIQYTK